MSDDQETTNTDGEPDIMQSLKEVLQRALHNDGLARGLKEAAKTLDRKQGLLCVLASDCNEPAYQKLVEALCLEHRVDLVKVQEKKKLGEWVGLAEYDKSGNIKGKTVACSCVVVKDYGEPSKALELIKQHLQQSK